eukprot:Clim_evm48s144 gene=Clim_evmTU48s144
MSTTPEVFRKFLNLGGKEGQVGNRGGMGNNSSWSTNNSLPSRSFGSRSPSPNWRTTQVSPISDFFRPEIRDSVPQSGSAYEHILQQWDYMSRNGLESWRRQYDSIEDGLWIDGYPSMSIAMQNPNANRYIDILPFNSTRVTLKEPVAETGSQYPPTDYINANSVVVKFGNRTYHYLVTQGPMASTVNAFWQMAWEQGSLSIVMITRVQERDRLKCEAYWPAELGETMHAGNISIKMNKKVDKGDWIEREFLMQNTNEKSGNTSPRTVVQYQYVAWPDHGVPETTGAAEKFVSRVRAVHDSRSKAVVSPMVVHCSAGVGRSGCFCALDVNLDYLRLTGGRDPFPLSVADLLRHFRKQRTTLIQTVDQFIFTHATIACAARKYVDSGKAKVKHAQLLDRTRIIQYVSNPGSHAALTDGNKNKGDSHMLIMNPSVLSLVQVGDKQASFRESFEMCIAGTEYPSERIISMSLKDRKRMSTAVQKLRFTIASLLAIPIAIISIVTVLLAPTQGRAILQDGSRALKMIVLQAKSYITGVLFPQDGGIPVDTHE